MMQLLWPWMLLLLPLPYLFRRWLRPVVTRVNSALRVPVVDDFEVAAASRAQVRITHRQTFWLVSAAWGLLILACTQPQWLGQPLEIPVSGRDLMLAVDLSQSMEITDFMLNGQQVDRLTATKEVARQFIARRTGDRLGLVLFGTQAYLQVPLTFDRTTVTQLLDEAVIGLAGENTAIGDAIGLAVKRLRDQTDAQKVLILMTDGANTAGVIEPVRAAELAANAGLKIYTIGIGADEMLVRRLFGTYRIDPSRDLDEKTLTAIAETTGGKYFRARDVQELETIYGELDKLEPVEHAGEHFRPAKDLFAWPLAAALALAGITVTAYLRQSR